MITYNFLFLVLLSAIFVILTVGLGYLIISLRAGLREYVKIRSDMVQLLSSDPKFYASKIEPIIRELMPKMIAQGGISQKPLKITGNSGIDGLITMYLGSKMSQAPNQTPQTQTPPESQTKPLNNPFE